MENLTEKEKFRLNYLKLERINAHLANERTYLAWIRSALSMFSLYISLFVTGDISGGLFWWIGGFYGLSCGVVVAVGYARYKALYAFLEMSYSEMAPTFGEHPGTREVFFLMGLTIVVACVAFFYVGNTYVAWSSLDFVF
mmetsp:Transcript_3733/g.5615  ORF Transcript_3733/g.5615 Transcript_3733/m.5615 type:complete len:140 (+) Transcript_3733:3-422(+)